MAAVPGQSRLDSPGDKPGSDSRATRQVRHASATAPGCHAGEPDEERDGCAAMSATPRVVPRRDTALLRAHLLEQSCVIEVHGFARQILAVKVVDAAGWDVNRLTRGRDVKPRPVVGTRNAAFHDH